MSDIKKLREQAKNLIRIAQMDHMQLDGEYFFDMVAGVYEKEIARLRRLLARACCVAHAGDLPTPVTVAEAFPGLSWENIDRIAQGDEPAPREVTCPLNHCPGEPMCCGPCGCECAKCWPHAPNGGDQ